MRQALQIHVPVRRARLRFESTASTVASPEAADELVDAIDAELALLRETPRPTTIRLVGDAATNVSTQLLGRLLDAIQTHVSRARAREFSVELSPHGLDADRAEVLAAAGIDRAALRVHSFDDLALRELGCLHDSEHAVAAVGTLRAAGFENVSIEIACGVPGSADENFLDSIVRTVALEPEHVVVRPLRPRPESTLGRWFDERRIAPARREAVARRFAGAVERLGAAGYEHYGVHVFARDGRRDLHRVEGWGERVALGVGPGARSQRGREVRVNATDPDAYVRGILDAGRAGRRRRLAPAAAAVAEVRRALRSVAGTTLRPIERRWKVDLSARLGPILGREIRRGTLESRRRRFRFTPQGWPVAEDVLASLR